MKNRSRLGMSILALSLLAGTFAGTWALAQPTSDAKQPPPPRGEERPRDGARPGPRGRDDASGPRSAEDAMKMMNRALKKLSKQIDDPTKREENLAAVLEMQRGCISSRALMPRGPWMEEKDADKRLTDLTPYRTHLITLHRSLLDLESHLLASKFEDAKADLGKIKTERDEGHKEMGVDLKD